MYYPDDLVEEVRVRNDIVDVIGSYIHLQKKGSNHFGLCPFHNEKSGSFSVSAPKQMFHCFGCGVSGNVYTFLMKYENMTFVEALQALADRAGVKLPEVELSAEEKRKNNLKKSILEANKEAAKYFYYQLKDESGKAGYDYLKNRELSDETIKNFGLGFARAGRGQLYGYLKSKQFSDEVLAKSGLFIIDEKNGMVDKFWNRVMFPIMDVNHRVIAFGGRVMGDGKPKYLNTQETEVFDKSRNLYGLNFARSSRKKNLIICEGYMDVIALHQAGFNQAVASLGTALTSGHASLMRRYTDEVLLTYDSDEAGITAALRAIPILKAAGLTARVINMQPYKDPDEFIKNLGADEFQKRIENAENSFYYEIRMLERGFDFKDPESKTKFFNEVAKRILRFEDELERENYIEGICDKYSVDKSKMQKSVATQAMKAEGLSTFERPKSGINSEKKDPNEGIKKIQKIILTWICNSKSVYKQIKPYIEVDDFSEDIYRKAASVLFEQIENGQLNEAKIIGFFTDEEEQTEVASLFNTNGEEIEEGDLGKALKDYIKRIIQYRIDAISKDDTLDVAEQWNLNIKKKNLLSELDKVSFSFKEET